MFFLLNATVNSTLSLSWWSEWTIRWCIIYFFFYLSIERIHTSNLPNLYFFCLSFYYHSISFYPYNYPWYLYWYCFTWSLTCFYYSFIHSFYRFSLIFSSLKDLLILRLFLLMINKHYRILKHKSLIKWILLIGLYQNLM